MPDHTPQPSSIPPEPTAIVTLVARARARIRIQNALERATTATILAAATALFAIFAMRIELISGGAGLALLAVAGGLIVAGAVIGAMVRLDDEVIARRIDRASNLSDRLSTAIAFRRTFVTAPESIADPETHDLMVAAIRDGVRAAPRANLIAATPFRWPKDLKAAFAFLAVSALIAGLAIPTPDRTPHVYRVEPPYGRPGVEITIHGLNLRTGLAPPVAAENTAAATMGAPGAAVGDADGTMEATPPFIPHDGSVYLGPLGQGRPIQILDWKSDTIRARIPADAPVGVTQLTVYIGKQMFGPLEFEVLAADDIRNFSEDAVLLDPAERAYVERILAELKDLAKREHIEDLDKFIAKIEKLLKDAQEGKITKEKLLAEFAKAEELLNQGNEPDPKEIAKKLGELGKELQKSDVTKNLGKALEKNDLDKAKKELEDLARKLEKSAIEKQIEDLEKKLKDPKLSEAEKKQIQKKIDQLKKERNQELEELKKQLEQDNKDHKLSEQERKDLEKKLQQLKNEKPLTEKQKQELQKQLEKVSQQMQKQSENEQKKMEQQRQQLQKQIRELQKKQQQAKTEKERLSAERQLNKKKDELQKLDKNQQQKNQSAQRQALKRLQRDMQKAAEQLQRPNQQQQDPDQAERERQAARRLKQAARETGRVSQDRRKRSQQRKMASQMEDLREAMQRAKRRGKKGPGDPFNKQAKNRDFGKRARGGQGNPGAWKPGQGQKNGQQAGNQGNQPGGKRWGTGHDDNLTGDPTGKTGNETDADLTGKTGRNGGSRRETILAAAQKGFAATSYKKVYQDYQKIVEEVMRNEKLPSSYRHYVKRYFSNIHPTGAPLPMPQAPSH